MEALHAVGKDFRHAVGKTLTLDNVPHTVIGIAAAGFRTHLGAFNDGAPRDLLFVALERHPRLRANPNLRVNRNVDWLNIHGRLDTGVDISQANVTLAATMSDLSKRYPATNEFKSASVEPYFSQGAANRRETRRTFGLMLGLAATVLLIVCVNMSGMMLVRGATRERELSIREAVGASRHRLIQYLCFEAV